MHSALMICGLLGTCFLSSSAKSDDSPTIASTQDLDLHPSLLRRSEVVQTQRRMTTLNVTQTDGDFPQTFSLRFLQMFWYALLGPLFVCVCACTAQLACRLGDLRRKMLDDNAEIVLMTDFIGGGDSTRGGGNVMPGLPASMMEMATKGTLLSHAPHPHDRLAPDHGGTMLEALRRSNAVSHLLTLTHTRLARLGLTPASLFEKGAVEFVPSPGQRSWAKPQRDGGLSKWEFVRALDRIGVALSGPDAELLTARLLGGDGDGGSDDDDGETKKEKGSSSLTGRITLSSFEKALQDTSSSASPPSASASASSLATGTMRGRHTLHSLASPALKDAASAASDSAFLRLFQGLGCPDVATAVQLVDPHGRGFFTSTELRSVIKSYAVPLNAKEVNTLEATLTHSSSSSSSSSRGEKLLDAVLFGRVLRMASAKATSKLLAHLVLSAANSHPTAQALNQSKDSLASVRALQAHHHSTSSSSSTSSSVALTTAAGARSAAAGRNNGSRQAAASAAGWVERVPVVVRCSGARNLAGPFLELTGHDQANPQAVSYRALQASCATFLALSPSPPPLFSSSSSCALPAAAAAAADLLGSSLDPSVKGEVAAQCLLFAALAHWHEVAVRQGFRFLAQRSYAFGNLTGPQQAAVLLKGRGQGDLETLRKNLEAELVQGGSGGGEGGGEWAFYLDALAQGALLFDAVGRKELQTRGAQKDANEEEKDKLKRRLQDKQQQQQQLVAVPAAAANMTAAVLAGAMVASETLLLGGESGGGGELETDDEGVLFGGSGSGSEQSSSGSSGSGVVTSTAPLRRHGLFQTFPPSAVRVSSRSLGNYLASLQALVVHQIHERLQTALILSSKESSSSSPSSSRCTLREVLIDVARDNNGSSSSSSSKNSSPSSKSSSTSSKSRAVLTPPWVPPYGTVTHQQVVEMLSTYGASLASQEVVTLLARLDPEARGWVSVGSWVDDARAFSESEEVWALLSDALGPAGGAQLFLFSAASSSSAPSPSSSTSSLPGSGSGRGGGGGGLRADTVMTLSELRKALAQVCASKLNLSSEDMRVLARQHLDPCGLGVVTVEHFVVCVAAHRRRRSDRAVATLAHALFTASSSSSNNSKQAPPVFSDFPAWLNRIVASTFNPTTATTMTTATENTSSSSNSSSSSSSLSSSLLNYDDVLAGLQRLGLCTDKKSSSPSLSSDEFLRGLLLSFDPLERGLVPQSAIEAAVEVWIADAFPSPTDSQEQRTAVVLQSTTNARGGGEKGGGGEEGGGVDGLGGYVSSLAKFNVRWRKDIARLCNKGNSGGGQGLSGQGSAAAAAMTAGEEEYVGDLTLLVQANAQCAAVVNSLRELAQPLLLANGKGKHADSNHKTAMTGVTGVMTGVMRARALKARHHLCGSPRLGSCLLKVIEVQKELASLYASARGFRLHGKALPQGEAEARKRLLARLALLVATVETLTIAVDKDQGHHHHEGSLSLAAGSAAPPPTSSSSPPTYSEGGDGGTSNKSFELAHPAATTASGSSGGGGGGGSQSLGEVTLVWKERFASRLWLELASSARSKKLTASDVAAHLLRHCDDGSGSLTYWEFFEAASALGLGRGLGGGLGLEGGAGVGGAEKKTKKNVKSQPTGQGQGSRSSGLGEDEADAIMASLDLEGQGRIQIEAFSRQLSLAFLASDPNTTSTEKATVAVVEAATTAAAAAAEDAVEAMRLLYEGLFTGGGSGVGSGGARRQSGGGGGGVGSASSSSSSSSGAQAATVQSLGERGKGEAEEKERRLQLLIAADNKPLTKHQLLSLATGGGIPSLSLLPPPSSSFLLLESSSSSSSSSYQGQQSGGATSTSGEEGDKYTNKVLKPGTPLLSLHTPTGEYFRATVLKDHGDGTVALQYALLGGQLGSEHRKSKKEVRSLRRGEETEGVWLKVSRVVGVRGLDDLRARGVDSCGNTSHAGLVGWLESRGLGSLETHDKHLLLADLDPDHKGVVSGNRFRTKLFRYRSKADALGINVLGMDHHQQRQEQEQQHDDDGGGGNDDDDDDDDDGARKFNKNVDAHEQASSSSSKVQAGVTEGSKAGNGSSTANSSLPPPPSMGGQEEARLQQLESMMFSMAQRELELALALAESQAEGKALDTEIERLAGLHPQFCAASSRS